jgi:hypothetical protein
VGDASPALRPTDAYAWKTLDLKWEIYGSRVIRAAVDRPYDDLRSLLGVIE